MKIDAYELEERIKWLSDKVGDKKVVLGVSGGIDSAVCLELLHRTFPKEKIIPIIMPVFDQSIVDSEKVCESCDLLSRALIFDITEGIETEKKLLDVDESDRIRRGNLIARTRMMVLYDQAKKHDALVCGTTNFSEVILGYYTLWGDGIADLEPITDLTKGQIVDLARHLQIDEYFIEKEPSADLWEGQTDASELGFSYGLVESVIEKMKLGEATDDESKWPIFDEDELSVIEHIRKMFYKRELPYRFNPKENKKNND
ncbi:MAG: NAD(+) synthase [Pseudomonadales bacterium]|jgi:NAD+ synthase|nr:NAD(+) synthase [Pseudomonadales bacterium]